MIYINSFVRTFIQLVVIMLAMIVAAHAYVEGGLVYNVIKEQIEARISDSSIAVELKFNSSTKEAELEQRADEITKVEISKFYQKYSSFRAKVSYNDSEVESISGKFISYIEIPVASRYLKFNDIISSSDVTTNSVRVDRLKRGMASKTSEVIGMRLKKPSINPGSGFRLSDLVSPPVIKSNDPVNIIYKSGSIKLKTTGTALSKGAVGENIKVRNDSSGAVILGEVINKSTVRVGGDQ